VLATSCCEKVGSEETAIEIILVSSTPMKHAASSINITTTNAHEFKAGRTTVFTMVGRLIAGVARADGSNVPYSIQALSVVRVFIMEQANPQELDMVEKLIKERRGV